MTDWITSPPVSSRVLVLNEETKCSFSVATWQVTPHFPSLILRHVCASMASVKRHLQFPYSKTYAPLLFHYLPQDVSLQLSNPPSAIHLLHSQATRNRSRSQKVLPFFICGIFENLLPIALLKNCIVHTPWVVFSFSALYQDLFWFSCVSLLLSLRRFHSSTPFEP